MGGAYVQKLTSTGSEIDTCSNHASSIKPCKYRSNINSGTNIVHPVAIGSAALEFQRLCTKLLLSVLEMTLIYRYWVLELRLRVWGRYMGKRRSLIEIWKIILQIYILPAVLLWKITKAEMNRRYISRRYQRLTLPPSLLHVELEVRFWFKLSLFIELYHQT